MVRMIKPEHKAAEQTFLCPQRSHGRVAAACLAARHLGSNGRDTGNYTGRASKLGARDGHREVRCWACPAFPTFFRIQMKLGRAASLAPPRTHPIRRGGWE